jgi:hypothetical protein
MSYSFADWIFRLVLKQNFEILAGFETAIPVTERSTPLEGHGGALIGSIYYQLSSKLNIIVLFLIKYVPSAT